MGKVYTNSDDTFPNNVLKIFPEKAKSPNKLGNL